ncbi:hypothetical protein [Piscinibacter gummiphilus]|uniref:Uncharacterized protein n=1 Tax=Piscinibacter gummiphilus TaxID=946333 RepID=A0ABZ0CPZ8_9BURK|nr:hypothetical protein [Piscinibacter gummiphilus]WOB06954.1 hypothetical protein RXV79_18750 [Piscinibacter gummiphilus]
MKLINLLDLALKSDEVVELLEEFDLPVVYDFDRLHEGIEDIYWVSAHGQGFQLRFDERQVLKTIFMYASGNEQYKPVDPSLAGVSFYSSFEQAKNDFAEKNVPVKTGQADNRWIKGSFAECSLHYEFRPSGELVMVTAMANRDA